MSNNRTGPQVKHCACIALPLSNEKEEDSELFPCHPPPPVTNKSVPSGPSPSPCGLIQDIPSSGTCLKPEFISLLEPPKKKVNNNIHPPFIKGQLGTIIFLPGFIRNCQEIPIGASLIIHNFRKPYKFEHAKTRYVLIDAYGTKWTSPETFNLWRECVESGEEKEFDQRINRLSIVRLPSCFVITSSICKNKISEQIHPIQMPGGTQADPEEMEAFPADNNESDPDFMPDKK